MGISCSLRGFLIGILTKYFFVALGGAQGLLFGRFFSGSLLAFAGKVAAGSTVWFCIFFATAAARGFNLILLHPPLRRRRIVGT